MPKRECDDYRVNLTASGEFKRQLAFLRDDTGLEDPGVMRLAVAELAKRRGYIKALPKNKAQ